MTKQIIMFYLPTLNAGGAERVTINILRYLDESLYELHLVMVSQSGVFLNQVPKHVKIHDLKSRKTLYSILKLRRVIKKINPSVIFSTLIRTHIALNLATIGIKQKYKLVMRMPTSPRLMMKHHTIGKVMKRLLAFSLKNADLVIAQTPEMKKEIEEYFQVEPSQIEVVLNILDKNYIDSMSDKEHSPFSSLETINVVASGLVRHIKGFDVLIKAFEEVYKQNNSFRLFILGRDNNGEMQDYQELIMRLNLKGIVKFMGHQDNPYNFYYHSDLFVLSSRHEGLPNVVLENLYLQKPVIATDCIPFMHTIINNGENGFVVEVDNHAELAEKILNFREIKKPMLMLDDTFFSIDNVFMEKRR